MVAQSNATTVQGGSLYRRGQPWRRPPRRAAEVEVLVDEFPQAQALGEGGRQAVVGWPGRRSIPSFGSYAGSYGDFNVLYAVALSNDIQPDG